MMRDIKISDVTMKLAASGRADDLTFKEKLELAKLLDHLGLSAIEIEGIESAKVDSLRIKSIASIVTESILAVPVKMDEEGIEAVWAALKGAAHPRLQVQTSVSPAQMEYIYHKKADAMRADIAASIKKCVELCDDVELIADDATRADGAYLRSVITEAIAAGAKTVTVCDAAGAMLPEEFAQFISQLVADVPELADVTLGIAYSDELHLADACAIAGVVAGVDEVKVTSYPMDTVSLENITKVLSTKSSACQATTSVRTTALKRTSSQIAWVFEKGRSKYSPFTSGVNEADDSIVLTVHDDKDAVIACASKLGYDLSEDDAQAVYEAFLRIATKKESVGSRELDAIVASAALQVPPTYILDSYVINSGNVIKATANVRLKKGDEVLECVCVGDGPIDASFLALEKMAGKHYELDDFQIQSVTEGQEAMGEAVVKLISEGKVYSGRGISTDIIGSSIRAYINALNKIVYEEAN